MSRAATRPVSRHDHPHYALALSHTHTALGHDAATLTRSPTAPRESLAIAPAPPHYDIATPTKTYFGRQPRRLGEALCGSLSRAQAPLCTRSAVPVRPRTPPIQTHIPWPTTTAHTSELAYSRRPSHRHQLPIQSTRDAPVEVHGRPNSPWPVRRLEPGAASSHTHVRRPAQPHGQRCGHESVGHACAPEFAGLPRVCSGPRDSHACAPESARLLHTCAPIRCRRFEYLVHPVAVPQP